MLFKRGSQVGRSRPHFESLGNLPHLRFWRQVAPPFGDYEYRRPIFIPRINPSQVLIYPLNCYYMVWQVTGYTSRLVRFRSACFRVLFLQLCTSPSSTSPSHDHFKSLLSFINCFSQLGITWRASSKFYWALPSRQVSCLYSHPPPVSSSLRFSYLFLSLLFIILFFNFLSFGSPSLPLKAQIYMTKTFICADSVCLSSLPEAFLDFLLKQNVICFSKDSGWFPRWCVAPLSIFFLNLFILHPFFRSVSLSPSSSLKAFIPDSHFISLLLPFPPYLHPVSAFLYTKTDRYQGSLLFIRLSFLVGRYSLFPPGRRSPNDDSPICGKNPLSTPPLEDKKSSSSYGWSRVSNFLALTFSSSQALC